MSPDQREAARDLDAYWAEKRRETVREALATAVSGQRFCVACNKPIVFAARGGRRDQRHCNLTCWQRAARFRAGLEVA